jgi:hypothetical protein
VFTVEEVIVQTSSLSEHLLRKISTERVKMRETDGVITLTPIAEKREFPDFLFGMFTDDKISTEKYSKQKQIDKELER